MTAPLRWDIYCRVIDHHGDVGVCWRLAAQLGARGDKVRLWLDEDSALRWMAPEGAVGVEVRGWPTQDAVVEAGDIVIEAFGCELPGGVLRCMAAMATPPVWINLEYLSAEAYVERAHRLTSPVSIGPAAGMRKTFFYPGFTPRTGGLLREADLVARQASFDREAWLRAQGLTRSADEQVVTLFCYEQTALPALLDQLASRPTLLLVTAGHAARQVNHLLGGGLHRGALRAHLLPALTQRAFDELLWAGDLNFVRGEDSFVRAQWAGKPFVWQAYPQSDDFHLVKVASFLSRFLDGAEAELITEVRGLWQAWNSDSNSVPALPERTGWGRHCIAWREALLTQEDLASQLAGHVRQSR